MSASLTPQLKKLLIAADCYFERQGKETMRLIKLNAPTLLFADLNAESGIDQNKSQVTS